MLIRFRAENIFSFKEQIEFSMIPSSERIHAHQVFRAKKRSDVSLTRFAAIYGANAAGKSNLVKAIKFAREIIMHGLKPEAKIPVQRFRLNQDCLHRPARFEIEFKRGKQMYEYGFELDPQCIHSEWLQTFTRRSDTLLFRRTTDKNGNAELEFGAFADKISDEEKLFLQFVGKGTRPNQLFLRESIERNVGYFRAAYDWFRKVLTIIEPMSDYIPVELKMNKDESFQEFLGKVLREADTGITSIKAEEIDLDNLEELSEDTAEFINESLSDVDGLFLKSPKFRLAAIKKDDQIRVLRLVPIHQTSNGNEEVIFEIHEESDGTQRLIDLAPLLHELVLGEDERVFIVDEFDRSLHPKLSRMIVEIHLDEANSTKPSQLIVTTHETNILDLDLLRRDEIWFVEKKPETGAADIYSLHDFQPRYDKDVLKDYLYGRYGAIPFLGNIRALRLSAAKDKSSLIAEGAKV